MHVEPETNEIVSVVVRDVEERKGLAATPVTSAQDQFELRAVPVTRGGIGLMKKCGFVAPSERGAHWEWRRSDAK
jgi:hypothetical protein